MVGALAELGGTDERSRADVPARRRVDLRHGADGPRSHGIRRGHYDGHVEHWWPRQGAPATAAGRLDLVSALESQLGLVLRQLHVDAYVLTIERAGRPRQAGSP